MAQPTRVHLGPQACPGGLCPSGHPSDTSSAHLVSSGLEKFSKKFRCVWTPFGIDFLRSKKKAKKQQLAQGTMSIG